LKRVCIHQPDFVPYLGFFHRLLLVDLFIVLDDVQFLRKGSGWHNRDKIKTKQGTSWLTLSVKKGLMQQKINEVVLNPQKEWIQRNLNLLIENYHAAPYFDEYFPKIRDIYQIDFVRMVDLNLAFLQFFFEIFDIHVDVLVSSNINVSGQGSQRLVNLVKAVDCTHYLTGTGSRSYLEEQLFIDNGIVVEWQNFCHPIYPQLHSPFIPSLSCLDVLFNCGSGAKEVLRSCLSEK
jgi:hypothetical protein